MQHSLRLSLVLLFLVAAAAHVAALGTMGAKTPISDAPSNKEIQDLGRFCVDQYNTKQKNNLSRRQGGDGALAPLEFIAVIAAEKQVVAGIKYFLTINIKEGRVEKTFNAELVVNPGNQSKDLLSFSPSTPITGSVTRESELGGLTEIPDARNSTEVQEMGKLAIELFNNKYQNLDGVSKPLVFEEVVEAKKQVVKGTKFHLKIVARNNGRSETFNGELLIGGKSIKLVSFETVTEGSQAVGRRFEIKDVKGNGGVQELGKFAVVEFNKNGQSINGLSRKLVFGEVVKAESQVVGGTKYYLKVKAREDGVTKYFDAEVLVEAGTGANKLLSFEISAA